MGNSNSLRMVGFNSPIEKGASDGKSMIELHDDSRSVPVSTTRNLATLKGGSENFGNCAWRVVLASIKTAFCSDKINLLLPCGPLAMLVDQLSGRQGWVFLLSLLGIIPLAERLGWATEQMAFYTGPTVGGLLNATFGNATELIISMYAMKQGMIRLVQQSLLGSILSNMLLVLGCALFGGGIANRNREQMFNRSSVGMNVGLLLMSVMGLLFPAVLHVTQTELQIGTSELALSRFTSCLMLVAYGIYIFFQLTNQKQEYVPIKEDGSPIGSPVEEESADVSKWESIIWLGLLTLFISVLSGPLSQNHIQAGNSLNSMGMLNDVNNNDGSPFDINDFPQLSSRPSSSGGAQGQIGSLRKQGLGVSPIVQQNQEFSIQNEDFPALPGFKGGNADYAMDLHQKDQLHDNNVSMMQSPHFSMGRSSGFNLGGTFSSHRPQQQQHVPSISSSGVSFSSVNNQDLLHLHGSDMFQGSHSSYHSQAGGGPGVGLRPLNSPNTVSGVGSYDQLIQQYQQQQNQSQFRLQQIFAASQSYRDQGMKSMQAAQAAPDRFGLLGLLSVIRMSDPDLTSLALGIDLTTLGLNLNSAENLHKTFGSPWLDEPTKGAPEFSVPQCYYAKQAPVLNQGYLSKFQLNTLFYIFYSMPKDEAQLYAANELYNRGWFYHREHHLWFMRAANMEPLVKTNAYERGSYICFDPNTWETIRKDNFVVYYEMLEKRPSVPPPPPPPQH